MELKNLRKRIPLKVTDASCALPRSCDPMRLLLFLILLVVCWPAALVVLVLYPFVWLLSLPFRIIGITMDGVFSLLRAILTLPARVLRAV